MMIFQLAMTIPKEGSYGFVYTLNIANNAPNADNAYTFLNALLASSEIGASMTKETGFISTYNGAAEHLTESEKKATAFTEVNPNRRLLPIRILGRRRLPLMCAQIHYRFGAGCPGDAVINGLLIFCLVLSVVLF